jgi:hypothetical protein
LGFQSRFKAKLLFKQRIASVAASNGGCTAATPIVWAVRREFKNI